MNHLRFFEKEGTVLIVTTVVVMVMSAISASLILQMQADSNYTRFTREKNLVEMVAKGAVHDGLRRLNDPDIASGNVGVTTWNFQYDTNGDGFPSEGETGVNFVKATVQLGGSQVFEARYAVYDEDLGNNFDLLGGAIDDNNDGTANDNFERLFHRLYVTAQYGSVIKKIVITVGGGEEAGEAISETFFKAIYAGNEDADPTYFLDLGRGKASTNNKDLVVGDIYIKGHIRLLDPNRVWKTEKWDDVNGDGFFDATDGDTITSGYDAQQEPGYLNFGSEATGTITNRNDIPRTSPWTTTQPTPTGNTADVTTGIPSDEELPPPDFTTTLDAVTIDVSAEIEAWKTANGATKAAFDVDGNITGYTAKDADHPAHMFIKVPKGSEKTDIGGYFEANEWDNGLDNYIIFEPTLGSNPTSQYRVDVSKPSTKYGYDTTGGNNQVYFINGNLLMGASAITTMNFTRPTTASAAVQNEPIRMTFIVAGNLLVNDDVHYRNSLTTNPGVTGWNPYEDAFAVIALENAGAAKHAVTGRPNSGNIIFQDKGGKSFHKWDGFFFAQNDFTSVFGHTDTNREGIDINGLMAAGNQIRINQVYNSTTKTWHARPDEDSSNGTTYERDTFRIRFDNRIRNITGDSNWLPGLPTGFNRSVPPVVQQANWNNILSWTEH